ncbi:hypothetical protein [Sutcliffiella horikoshii]|uniref:hypothetical protein n=1 Tax=Sutcliffiella horikoshii TaxID=79883 RepID=UPI00384EB0DB
MSFGHKYYAEIKEVQATVYELCDKLSGLQSVLDKKISKIYHDIERTPELDADQSYIILRDLKETLAYRRVVKDELKLLQPVRYLFSANEETLETQFNRAVRYSYDIREALNAQITIEEVFEALNV